MRRDCTRSHVAHAARHASQTGFSDECVTTHRYAPRALSLCLSQKWHYRCSMWISLDSTTWIPAFSEQSSRNSMAVPLVSLPSVPQSVKMPERSRKCTNLFSCRTDFFSEHHVAALRRRKLTGTSVTRHRCKISRQVCSDVSAPSVFSTRSHAR